MHNDNTASIRNEVTGLRKDVFQLRKERDELREERDELREERDELREERDELREELKIRDMIIAFYEHELNETMKDLDILHKVNMSLGAMIAVWVDQKKKG